MTIIIYVFGTLIIICGLLLLIMPNLILGPLQEYKHRPGVFIGAIAARLVLGSILVYMAPLSEFPLIIAILGWVSLIAAGVFTTIGIKRFREFMDWILMRAAPFSRPAGLIAAVFGAFLIYAFY